MRCLPKYYDVIPVLCLTIWIYLILLAGDVELNPGPASIDSESISNDLSDSSIIDLSIFEQNFSIVHYNIQSLVGKLDQIQIELSHFDVIALSESWLSENVSTEEILFQNYQRPFRKDRVENSYGGIIINIKENIPCKRRLDLEIDGLECIWLEIKLKNKNNSFKPSLQTNKFSSPNVGGHRKFY